MLRGNCDEKSKFAFKPDATPVIDPVVFKLSALPLTSIPLLSLLAMFTVYLKVRSFPPLPAR